MRVLVGFDGSASAATAIEAGATLLPGAHGLITYVWAPPFASAALRRRLRERIANVNDLVAGVDAEGEFEAQRIAARGVALAVSAGWEAEPLIAQTYSAEGAAIVRAAEEAEVDLVVIGSRGLGGKDAVLGSVSDMVVHYASRPVLVCSQPMLSTEWADLADGPLVVGWDGSAAAQHALANAGRIFGQRKIIAVSVDDDTDVPAPPGSDILHMHVRQTGPRRAGGVAAAMMTAAEEHRAAAIIVGSRGRSAAREIIMGSVAMGTLHRSHRPVLVVHGPGRGATD
jgi:nucleotide-binding universal stress UspA family protein